MEYLVDYTHRPLTHSCCVSLKVSREKNPYYFPLYWLVNKDPYNGLL